MKHRQKCEWTVKMRNAVLLAFISVFLIAPQQCLQAAPHEAMQPKMLILSPEILKPSSGKESVVKNGNELALKDLTAETNKAPFKEIKPKLIVKPETLKSQKTVAKTVLKETKKENKKPVMNVALKTPAEFPAKKPLEKDVKQVSKTRDEENVNETLALDDDAKSVPDVHEKEPVSVIAESLPESKMEAEKLTGVIDEKEDTSLKSESVLETLPEDKPELSNDDAKTMNVKPDVIKIADSTLTPPSALTFIPAEEKREVQIVVGESKIISAIGLVRAAVGNPAVADVVVVSNHELLINGKLPGTTTLTLWDKRGRLTYIVTVLKEPLSTKTRIFPLQFLWLKKHEVKTGDGKVTWTITTNSMLMSEIDKSLSLGISKDSFSINTELNNIVVQGTEKDIQKAEMILKGLDVPPQQILIEAKVLEVTDDDAKTLGISWNMNKEKVSIKYDTSGGQFKIDTLGALSEQYVAKIDALQETGKANLLANPKIAAVIHRDPGVVFLGDSIPVVTTTKDSTGSSLQSVTYVEVGVNLFFLPTSISEDGYVTMFVHSVSTSVSGFTSAGYPMFKGKSIRSELRIKDGEAVVMGGLLRSDETEVLQKVPYLGDLPFLGNFFKNKKKTKKNSEMIVIFIPHILKSGETLPASSMMPMPFGKN